MLKGETYEKISTNNTLLNKKRAKSKIIKRKSKPKVISQINKITQKTNLKRKIFFITKKAKDEDKINLIRQNVRHFFRINWENDIYLREISRISETLNDLVFWFLIDSSYFVEENIYDYIKILKQYYLENNLSCDYIEEKIKNNNNNEDWNEVISYYKETLNITSYDIYDNSNNDKVNKNINEDASITLKVIH